MTSAIGASSSTIKSLKTLVHQLQGRLKLMRELNGGKNQELFVLLNTEKLVDFVFDLPEKLYEKNKIKWILIFIDEFQIIKETLPPRS